MEYQKPPRWGEFVSYADNDVITFAVLWVNFVAAAFYHAQQAIEKYLKALVLSIADPLGETTTSTDT
jgi:hypothetical protein